MTEHTTNNWELKRAQLVRIFAHELRSPKLTRDQKFEILEEFSDLIKKIQEKYLN